jgi:Cap4 SAVED domain
MRSDLFTKWLKTETPQYEGVALYVERDGARAIGLTTLKGLLADHFVGEASILRAGGFKKAAGIIANSLPEDKKTRSGDLGELLATEYVNSETSFVVPIKKLRWKSDRQMAMHGNDVIGVDSSGKTVRVLKCESKSGIAIGNNVVEDAIKTLDLHDGRPNPSTLAFITKRLYEDNRDDEANVFRDLQVTGKISASIITHMIFALSGNDAGKFIAAAPKPKQRGIKRENATLRIKGHAAFVSEVYKTHGT